MSINSNKNKENPDFYSLEEPAVAYNVTPKTEVNDSEMHPVLIKLLEKGIKEANEGKLISHEEAMRRIKLKIQSLK